MGTKQQWMMLTQDEIDSMTGEEFLQSKDIWNHPTLTDRNNKECYDVAELLELRKKLGEYEAQKELWKEVFEEYLQLLKDVIVEQENFNKKWKELMK